jgi:hypothetical protein
MLLLSAISASCLAKQWGCSWGEVYLLVLYPTRWVNCRVFVYV